MVREIRGAKINPKSSFKNSGAQNTWGRKLREQIRYLKVKVKNCDPTDSSANNCDQVPQMFGVIYGLT